MRNFVGASSLSTGFLLSAHGPQCPDPASAAPFLPEGLLLDLLDVSLTAINLLRPCYGPGGELTDFAPEYFNPAAQRMTGLPERPAGTARTLFPDIFTNGIFDFYRQVFNTGEPGRFKRYYQADGLDNYFHLAARRSGERLLVSFTDTADQPRTAAETALRDAQAAEKTARAEAELQRQRFYEVLMVLPALVATYHGPDHRYNFVNAAYQRYFPAQALPGRSLREVLPESEAQGVLALMDRVYQTGESSYQQELEVWLDFEGSGRPRQLFLNLLFHPLRNAQGRVDGLLDFSYDVTEQVQARRQVEQLNQELGVREQASTREAEAARADAEHQRALLESIFRQAPAAIAVYGGPDFVFELVNPVYQELLPGRPLLGKPVREAFPEVAELPVYDTLRQVYETGLTHHEQAQLIPVAGPAGGLPEDRYFDFTLQARYDEQRRVDGVIGFGFEVTAQVVARRQAEALQADLLAAARRQGQERAAFHAVFEQTPALIALLRSPGHRYEYVNPAYQALFPGRPLRGLAVAAAVPEMQEQGFVALLDHVYQAGETYSGREVPFEVAAPGAPARRQTYFNFTMQAYREDGAIAGISIFAFDVTEQVQARQEREAQQQRLREVFAQAPVAIFVLRGPSYLLEVVNAPMGALLGHPPAELLGKPYFEAVPELASQGYPELLAQVWASGQPYVATERAAQLVRHQRNETGYFNFVYQPLRDAQGRVAGITCVATEVTEQVRARQASEATAQQLRLLTDALPVLIAYLDREEKYRFANQAYEPWFGQRPAQLLGRPIREIAGPQAYPVIRPYIARALAGERVEFEAEMPYRPGFTKHIRTSYIPDVHHGAVQGFYTLVSDITEQVEARQAVEASAQQARALAQELAAANQQLTRTNVDLDNFIYTASHDLKAPITNIEGLLDALQHELPAQPPTGEVAHILGLMQDAVERFQRTIEHLTAVSKLQKEHDPPTAQVALAPVIEDVRLDLAPLLQQTGGRLHVRVPDCPPLTFSEKNLRSVVYNLLSNALKYRHPDRRPDVHVRCRQEAGYVVLEVQDNGLGLDLARETQLFAMFQRLHTHVEGSGLGSTWSSAWWKTRAAKSQYRVG